MLRNHFTLDKTPLVKFPFCKRVMEKILYLPKFSHLVEGASSEKDFIPFIENIFNQLNIHFDFVLEDLKKIPPQGPVIVLANHPFGLLDGLVLAYFLNRIRSDTKFLANYLLKDQIPFSDLLISVNPFNNKSKGGYISGLKAAHQWLEKGNLLGIFPSGTVSHWTFRERRVLDPTWNDFVVSLAERNEATLVPFYFVGRNSWYFHMVGLISSLFRTLLLPQQFFAKTNETISFKIGQPIRFSELKILKTSSEKIIYLRNRIYLLLYAKKSMFPIDGEEPISAVCSEHEKLESRNNLIKNLHALPQSACLIEQGEFSVYIANAEELPHILLEIGRLRELTFRCSGEGTGNAIDLDEFDFRYLHIFIWHKKTEQIIGAYRLGLTDQVNKNELYITTLYTISAKFFEYIHPAIELGRLFVIPEYQKKSISLILLWKAVLKFVSQNPRYQSFYGVVSISSRYQNTTRSLIKYFLSEHYARKDLMSLVQARYPYSDSKNLPQLFKDITHQTSDFEHLKRWIKDLELDNKSLPILLQYYQGVSAKVIGFNVDPNFNNTLDCFYFVKMKEIPLKKLNFYMGKAAVQSYFKFHEKRAIHE